MEPWIEGLWPSLRKHFGLNDVSTNESTDLSLDNIAKARNVLNENQNKESIDIQVPKGTDSSQYSEMNVTISDKSADTINKEHEINKEEKVATPSTKNTDTSVSGLSPDKANDMQKPVPSDDEKYTVDQNSLNMSSVSSDTEVLEKRDGKNSIQKPCLAFSPSLAAKGELFEYLSFLTKQYRS